METPNAAGGETTEPTRQTMNVGAILRDAREAQGMSVYDVAERIKFAPRQIEALEANDFANLPKATFLRGFVRSYARVLQLDEAALIAALPAEVVPQAAVGEKTLVNVAFPGKLALQRINLMWLAGALGVVLLLVLFLWAGGGDATAQKPTEVVVEPVSLPMQAASAVEAPATDAQPVEVSKPVEMKKPEVKPKVAEKAVAPVKPVVPEKPAVQEKPVVKPAPVVTAPTAATPEAKPPVALELLKRRPLHFVFSGAAWVEVIDVHGDILLSRTNVGGTEKWIGGPKRAPYDISIGHPGNVKLYYKGREIDLSAYAGMETARIKVE